MTRKLSGYLRAFSEIKALFTSSLSSDEEGFGHMLCF